MPADQIFVLVLVIGIVLGLGWLSWDSRRREQMRREQANAMAESVAESATNEAEPQRVGRRTQRKR